MSIRIFFNTRISVSKLKSKTRMNQRHWDNIIDLSPLLSVNHSSMRSNLLIKRKHCTVALIFFTFYLMFVPLHSIALVMILENFMTSLWFTACSQRIRSKHTMVLVTSYYQIYSITSSTIGYVLWNILFCARSESIFRCCACCNRTKQNSCAYPNTVLMIQNLLECRCFVNDSQIDSCSFLCIWL